jgi:hypothetical protein
MTEENKPIKFEYQLLSWGPCVCKLKITDEFKNLLLKEGEASSIKEHDYQHRLAGIIQKEFKFRDYNVLLPYVDEFLKMYTKIFEQWKNQKFKHAPQYLLRAMWINYQRQNEFNPPHDHADDLSFVIYLKVPEEINKEFKAYRGRSCGPGGVQFVYGDGNRQAITYQSHFPEENDLFVFPAWLKHWVAPFKADVERISVSGNISSQVPLNSLKKVGDNQWQPLKNAIGDYDS